MVLYHLLALQLTHMGPPNNLVFHLKSAEVRSEYGVFKDVSLSNYNNGIWLKMAHV